MCFRKGVRLAEVDKVKLTPRLYAAAGGISLMVALFLNYRFEMNFRDKRTEATLSCNSKLPYRKGQLVHGALFDRKQIRGLPSEF